MREVGSWVFSWLILVSVWGRCLRLVVRIFCRRVLLLFGNFLVVCRE